MRRKRENEGTDRGLFGEKRVEEVEVFRGDKNGYSETGGGKVVGEVEEGYHVPLRRIREDQDVCAGFRHPWKIGARISLGDNNGFGERD